MHKLIHLARIQPDGRDIVYLLLRKVGDLNFTWFEDSSGEEKVTVVNGVHAEDAIRQARKYWGNVAFRTVICGFRYTLPERDECGQNALFHQMASSYASMNGQYFDDEVGHNCIVHNASQEARQIWQRLRDQKKL